VSFASIRTGTRDGAAPADVTRAAAPRAAASRVTETGLAAALNVSYMAQQIAIFGIVVGIALVLTGVGLVILAFAVFGRERRVAEPVVT
jgi:hypothetical protein